MKAKNACLMIVDVQQRLLTAMDSPRAVVSGCGLMMKAAGVLGVPILVTEQYPEGLGPTVEPLAELTDGDTSTRTGVGGEDTSRGVEELKQSILGVHRAAGRQEGILRSTGTSCDHTPVRDREAVVQLVNKDVGLSSTRPCHGRTVIGQVSEGSTSTLSEAVDVVATQTELEVVLTSEAGVEVQLSVVAKGEGVLVSNLVLVGGISSQTTHEQLSSLLDVLGVALSRIQ